MECMIKGMARREVEVFMEYTRHSHSQDLNSQWLPLDKSENGVCDVAGDQVEDKVPAWVQLPAGGEGT